ncbi:MAG: sulfotransferase [Thalassolituus sp.]
MAHIAFVTGYPRSGTTMLATMLARHANICTMGETHFFLSTNFRPLRKHTHTWWNHFINHNRRFQIIDFRLPDNESAELLNAYCQTKNADWFIEKSPTHVDVLPSIRKAYPDAPIIHIVRDVRDTTASMLNASWAHNSPLKHISEWKAALRRVKRYSAKPGMNILHVRYEDLLTNPEAELTRILKHIDPTLAYSDSLLSDTTSTDAIPEYEKAWKQKAGEKPDASRIFAWKTTPEAWHNLAALANSELGEWGYELQRNVAQLLARQLASLTS